MVEKSYAGDWSARPMRSSGVGDSRRGDSEWQDSGRGSPIVPDLLWGAAKTGAPRATVGWEAAPRGRFGFPGLPRHSLGSPGLYDWRPLAFEKLVMALDYAPYLSAIRDRRLAAAGRFAIFRGKTKSSLSLGAASCVRHCRNPLPSCGWEQGRPQLVCVSWEKMQPALGLIVRWLCFPGWASHVGRPRAIRWNAVGVSWRDYGRDRKEYGFFFSRWHGATEKCRVRMKAPVPNP